MTPETLEELAYSRISVLVDRLAELHAKGAEVMMVIVHAEIIELRRAMYDEDYEFFYATDYRHLEEYEA